MMITKSRGRERAALKLFAQAGGAAHLQRRGGRGAHTLLAQHPSRTLPAALPASSAGLLRAGARGALLQADRTPCSRRTKPLALFAGRGGAR